MSALVVFACVHAAGRSQMAAAWFNALADPSLARAVPAGTQPAAHVHPEVAAVLAEAGLSPDPEGPRALTAELARDAQLLITMGCGENCPHVPGLERLDWPLPDPKGRPLDEVRRIRDGIREQVAGLIAERGWGGEASRA